MLLVLGIISFLHLPKSPYYLNQGIYIIKANADGSADIYDYREYTFPSGHAPSSQMPYYLTGKGITYTDFEAQQVSFNITEITTLREIWDIFTKVQGLSLPVSGENGNYTIDIPKKEHLQILIHYRVYGITTIGKDFARTYIRVPSLGQTEGVYMKNFMLGFMLPSSIDSCRELPAYESSSTLPCISINRYFAGGTLYIPPSVWGKEKTYSEGTLWIEKHVPVKLIHIVDAVYPKELTTGKHISTYFSDIAGDRDNMFMASYEIYKKGNEFYRRYRLKLNMAFAGTSLLIGGGLLIFLGLLLIYIRQRHIETYYVDRLRKTPASMDMPNNEVYRSFFFTKDDLDMALQGSNPYNYPALIADGSSVGDIIRYVEKGENAFKGIFLSLVQKEYLIPAVEDGKPVGFYITDKDEGRLPPHERIVLKHMKKAATTKVKHKLTDLFRQKSAIEIANQMDKASILLPEEFQAYVEKHVYPIKVGKHEVLIPMFLTTILSSMTALKNTMDIPPAIKLRSKGLGRWFIILGVFFGILGFFMADRRIASLLFISGTTGTVLLLGTFAILITAMIIKNMYIPTPSYLHPTWFDEYVGWHSVEKWIINYTRLPHDIDTYSGLNWDKYLIFAALRGKEKLPLDALNMSPHYTGNLADSLILTGIFLGGMHSYISSITSSIVGAAGVNIGTLGGFGGNGGGSTGW